MSEIGSGSGSSYPTTLDTDTTVEVNSPSASKTKARAEVANDLGACIVAIETELGTDPAGTKADVKTFLQTEHDADGTHGNITTGTITAAGAVSGVTTLSMSGQLTSTLATGTAPLVIASTTEVANLKAATATLATTATNMAMTGEASAENAGLITTTAAGVEVVALNLNNVTAGDRIYVFMIIAHDKGTTGGHNIFYLLQKSGTATAQIGNDWPLTAMATFYQSASTGGVPFSCNTIVKVTGTGTLELKLSILSSGSDGTINAGNGQIYAFFLKKQ